MSRIKRDKGYQVSRIFRESFDGFDVIRLDIMTQRARLLKTIEEINDEHVRSLLRGRLAVLAARNQENDTNIAKRDVGEIIEPPAWAIEAEVVTLDEDVGLGVFVKGTAKVAGRLAVFGKKLVAAEDLHDPMVLVRGDKGELIETVRPIAADLLAELQAAAKVSPERDT